MTLVLIPERSRTSPAPPPHPAAVEPARIGPNALIQTFRAIGELHGPEAARELLARAECPAHAEEMVDERHFVRLVDVLHRALGPAGTTAVLAASGRYTGEYVRAHRIPRLVAGLLPRLPTALALRLLLRAFDRHAWTFVGSGRMRWSLGACPVLCIAGCITCRGRSAPRPLGAFYQAAFESLLCSLVDPRIRVVEEACLATGAAECRFRIHLPARGRVAAALPQPGGARCASC